jgi:MFS family permease
VAGVLQRSRYGSFYQWYVVAVLTVAYIISGLDRTLISFLIDPIKHSFALGDFQAGLLLGPAFGIFYALFGIPVGWLADFRSRRNIIAIGIVTWCLMTALCGFAGSFLQLFIARIGVGAGEAALSPCALSIISDYHPRGRRAAAIGVYMTGSFLGSALAFFLGPRIVALVSTWPELTVPGFRPFVMWQMVVIAVGLAGLAAFALVMTIAEPAREELILADCGPQGVVRTGIGDALRFLLKHYNGVGFVILAMACIFTLGYTSFWTVALFERTWHWTAHEIGTAQGILIFVCGILGTQFGGRLADWLSRRGRRNGPLLGTLLGAVIALPGYCLTPLMPSGGWAYGAMIVAMLGQAIASACGPAAVIHAAPSELRAKMAALYFTIASLISLLLGPSSVGWLADRYGGPEGLRYALFIVCAVFGLMAILLLLIARQPYSDGVERLEARLGIH